MTYIHGLFHKHGVSDSELFYAVARSTASGGTRYVKLTTDWVGADICDALRYDKEYPHLPAERVERQHILRHAYAVYGEPTWIPEELEIFDYMSVRTFQVPYSDVATLVELILSSGGVVFDRRV